MNKLDIFFYASEIFIYAVSIVLFTMAFNSFWWGLFAASLLLVFQNLHKRAMKRIKVSK